MRRLRPRSLCDSRACNAGFSLIEVMIAMGLMLVVGVILLNIYLRVGQSYSEMERANRQMENGRFVVQLLRDDLWHAGYWAEYMPSATAASSAIPNPCLAYNSATWTATVKNNLILTPVQGYNTDPGGAEAALPAECNGIVADKQAGTDVLVVRHADTCAAGVGSCEADTAGKLYLQTSLCSSSINSYVLDTAAASFTLQKKDCSTASDKRKYVSNIYYVRDYHTASGDGVPTLVRAQFDLAAGTVGPQAAEVLVPGIESLQVEYALDSNGDGNPDSYTNCNACTAAQWSQVVAVKLHVLARNTETAAGHSDTKTYTLGYKADGSAATLGPFNDAYKRHVFSTVVRLINPMGRKDRP